MSIRITAATLTAMMALGMAVAALLAAAPVAQAEERVCRGTIGAKTVDNLRVPQGASCTLEGTKVQGTIKVENAANLVARNVRVIGNVQSQGFKNIKLVGSAVGGSVQLENGLEGGFGNVVKTKVNGDVQYFSNEAKMAARGNTLLANLQVVGNTGGVTLTDNRISENMQCKENVPPPTGGGNRAGDKEDQCAAL
jgi:uncharacterized membrane protein